MHGDFLPFKPPKEHQAQANALITVAALCVARSACRACRKARAALGNHLLGSKSATEMLCEQRFAVGSCGAGQGMPWSSFLEHRIDRVMRIKEIFIKGLQ